MIEAAGFVGALRELGYSRYAGVPCSFIEPFINHVIDDPALDYVGATSEGEAVGVNAGAWLAGRNTVTMCQNSGLGNMVNPLTSVNHPCRIPSLLIVTWRGQPGLADEPQHGQMGRITPALLDTLEIPWLAFPSDASAIEPTLARAESLLAERSRPVALVMEKGSVAPRPLAARAMPAVSPGRASVELGAAGEARLTRTEALRALLDTLTGEEAIVATTGKTGRELFTLADRPGHFYVVGGMGTASAIGFGIAHALPAQPVVVIDGDGAALMKLGNLATIGHHRPGNLLHLLLDNEQHDSTGGQATVSGGVGFAAIAAACGYRRAVSVDRPDAVRGRLAELVAAPGPNLLHVKIAPGSPRGLGRPTVSPADVKARFVTFLARRAARA